MDIRDYPEAFLQEELEAYGTRGHVLDRAAKEIKSLRKQLAERDAKLNEYALELDTMEEQIAHCQTALALKDEALFYALQAWQYDGVTDEHGSTFRKADEIAEIKPDNATLREWGARLLEESGKRMGSRVPSDYADELRSGEWTPAVLR